MYTETQHIRYIWPPQTPPLCSLTLSCIYHNDNSMFHGNVKFKHYSGVIMGTMASQITSLTVVYSTFYSGADQIKHQSSAPLAFVKGIQRLPVTSPHLGPVTRKMFPFDDVIICIFLFTGTVQFSKATKQLSSKFSTHSRNYFAYKCWVCRGKCIVYTAPEILPWPVYE